MVFSIPGLILPAAIAAAGYRHAGPELRAHAGAVVLCATANIALALYQAGSGIATAQGGLHLANFFVLYLVARTLLGRAQVGPFAAFSGTWLSLIGADVVGALAMPGPQSALAALTWVGGSGWSDSLLLLPAISAAAAIVAGRPEN